MEIGPIVFQGQRERSLKQYIKALTPYTADLTILIIHWEEFEGFGGMQKEQNWKLDL